MKDPNFFIIGAPKCGTTSLATWLSEHPQVFMSPVKEPHYFSFDFSRGNVRDMDEYRQLFTGAPAECLSVGEASTEYLFSDVAVKEIESHFPGARYIVMVRNPVDLAFSLYKYEKAGGREVASTFEEAWRRSPERRRGDWVGKWCSDPKWLDYQMVASTGWQLERLFGVVDQERVLVLILDDVKEDPSREYRKVLDFLELGDDGRKKFQAENRGRSKKSSRVVGLVNHLGRLAKRAKRMVGIPEHKGLGFLRFMDSVNSSSSSGDVLSPSLQREMSEYFRVDVELTSTLLARDLSSWVLKDSTVEAEGDR